MQSHRHRRGSHVPWGVFFFALFPGMSVGRLLSGFSPWGSATPVHVRGRTSEAIGKPHLGARSSFATGTWFGLCVVTRDPSAVRPCLQRCQVETRAARGSEPLCVGFERLTVPKMVSLDSSAQRGTNHAKKYWTHTADLIPAVTSALATAPQGETLTVGAGGMHM